MWQPGCWPAWHRGEEKMGASTLFCTGRSWGSQTQLPALLVPVAQGIPPRGRVVQGPCMQRLPPQDWPTGVLSYVCWEASWKQSNNGFMSNRASVMFKAWSTFPPIPQQAASALPPPFGSPVVEGRGSSVAAGLQGTTYWKRCCCKQDGCWRKVVVMGGQGEWIEEPAQTVALRQVSRGLAVILWEGVQRKTKAPSGEWSLLAEWLSEPQHGRPINFCSLSWLCGRVGVLCFQTERYKTCLPSPVLWKWLPSWRCFSLNVTASLLTRPSSLWN